MAWKQPSPQHQVYVCEEWMPMDAFAAAHGEWCAKEGATAAAKLESSNAGSQWCKLTAPDIHERISKASGEPSRCPWPEAAYRSGPWCAVGVEKLGFGGHLAMRCGDTCGVCGEGEDTRF